jgi:tRNA U55 pseudouridine synthase TruB
MHKKPTQYFTISKKVGETPLQALEQAREIRKIDTGVPLAYAGRLDPMASGKLLILVGDECKVQEKYHAFDKEYIVEILLGVSSDSGDVLGLITPHDAPHISELEAQNVLQECTGTNELPYPHFSSRTVQGKPLHTWALEKRLHEITIPTKRSAIYALKYEGIRIISKSDLVLFAQEKIETIPKIVDPRKALGADFRREEVRATWNDFSLYGHDTYQILSFTCIASSGTYMRSLGEHIAQALGTKGLAYSIHRTKIGKYFPLFKSYGFWWKCF